MKTMYAAMIVVALTAGVAQADWQPGDGHKMHYPQLPDPSGWDVNVTADMMFDDWQCSATGAVSDVHLWVSWRGDSPSDIMWIDLEIWSDVPKDSALNVLGYSYPEAPQWETRLLPGQWTMRPDGSGNQGWLDFQNPPPTESGHPGHVVNDHQQYYQINISDIQDPFTQERGNIYWLGVHIGVTDVATEIGWKTSLNHWNDDAVYWWTFPNQIPPEDPDWREMIDPIDGKSLDMAFVITPEPATMTLFALGGLALLRRR